MPSPSISKPQRADILDGMTQGTMGPDQNFLGGGRIFPNFHLIGKVLEIIDLLITCWIGLYSASAAAFIAKVSMQLSPCAVLLFSCLINLTVFSRDTGFVSKVAIIFVRFPSLKSLSQESQGIPDGSPQGDLDPD